MRLLVAAAFLCVMMGAGQAMACSCEASAFGPDASRKNIARAMYIVQGHVTFVAPEDAPKSEEYKGLTAFGISVDKVMKGEETPMLAAYAMTKSSCGLSIESLKRQERFILYKKGENLVLAGACNNYLSPDDQRSLLIGNYK